MILPSLAQSSPFHTPYARRCMARPEALQGPPTPLPPEAVIGWPRLRDVFGASSTTAIGEPALLKPANIPAKVWEGQRQEEGTQRFTPNRGK